MQQLWSCDRSTPCGTLLPRLELEHTAVEHPCRVRAAQSIQPPCLAAMPRLPPALCSRACRVRGEGMLQEQSLGLHSGLLWRRGMHYKRREIDCIQQASPSASVHLVNTAVSCPLPLHRPPDSVTVIVQSSSQAINGAATATSEAVSRAAASVCTGGNVQAAAQAAAQVRTCALSRLVKGCTLPLATWTG